MDDRDKTHDELLREIAVLRRELAQARKAAGAASAPREPRGESLLARAPSGELTDKDQVERELRRQEQRLRLIVDGVHDHAISMLDAAGRIITFNAAAERIKGFRLAEVQGQHFRLFFLPEDRAGRLPETELEVARTQGRYEGEGWRQRKDGSRFYAAVSLSALHDADGTLVGFVKVTQDRTRSRELGEALARREEQLRLILEGVDDGITLQDATGAIVYANEAAARAVGVASVAELLATPVSEIMSRFTLLDDAGKPLSAERWPSRRALQGERVSEELLCFRGVDSPQERWSVVSSTPLFDASGVLRHVVNIFKDVTDRRRADAALRQSERQFRALFENALDAILVSDDAQRLLDANEAATELLGRSRESLLRHEVTELVAPPQRDEADALWASMLATGRQRGELDLVRPDGAVRHVEYSATANFIPGRHLSVLRDVTERRVADNAIHFLAEASTALTASLDLQQTLATVAKLCVPTLADWAAVDMKGPDGTLQRLAVVHTDPAKVSLAHDLWQRRRAALDDTRGLGRVLRTGEPDVNWEISDAMLTASVDDPELLAVYRALQLGASMIVPLTLRGAVVGGITLATEGGRRFSERDLMLASELARRASVAIENATLYRDAKEASQLKDEFLATVSHELRTPLTAVLGWAMMVRARLNDPTYVAKALDTIERNARAQVQLIQDLLDISRVITGKLRLDVMPVDLSEVVETALDTVRPAARAKGITLTPVLDPSAEAVMGDSDRLVQVVNNLLINAVKFTSKGGHVRVYLHKVDSSVELVVRDTGEGIPPAFLPHVFERFRQADGGLTRTRGGLGLGLAITRSLVELHGGTIRAESAGEGQGSTFTVRLPIAGVRTHSTSSPASAAAAHAPVGLECPPQLAGLRILVVDDEPDTRNLLQVVLEHCKVRVATAGSASEALTRLGEERFDMLISDIGMPGEDGYSLIRKVRAAPAEDGGRIPAIALTAYASSRDRTRALIAGYSVHLPKPVDPAELVVTVANQLGRFVRA